MLPYCLCVLGGFVFCTSRLTVMIKDFYTFASHLNAVSISSLVSKGNMAVRRVGDGGDMNITHCRDLKR
jgi:hypothetical protein